MSRLALPCLVLALAAGGCTASFTTRYTEGNANLSTGLGAAYLIILSPILQAALNACIPAGTRGASPVIVIVADIDAAGTATHMDIEPDSGGTDCLAQQLTGRSLPRPPLKPGASTFPIGLKVETR